MQRKTKIVLLVKSQKYVILGEEGKDLVVKMKCLPNGHLVITFRSAYESSKEKWTTKVSQSATSTN